MGERLYTLFQKYLNNQHSEAELDELLRYAEREEDEQSLREFIGQEVARMEVLQDNEEDIDRLVAGVKQKLCKRIEPQIKPVQRLSAFKCCYYAAAIVFVTLSTTLYFYPGLIVNRKSSIVTEILPAGNKATLTLADGTKINLDSAKAGIQINNEDINYNDGTKIKAPILHSSSITYNSLTTPRGGQYQIVLSDGTKVWLNAQSTLKYPSRFIGSERTVQVSGEAYFSIKEDKTKPFKVLSEHQEIRVLGTEFNISSYSEDKETKTTLVSGAVQVASYKSYTLKLGPGEQSTIQKDGTLTKAKVDVNREIAWTKGEAFDFTDKTLKQAMTELSRWYDITVIYKGQVPEGTFNGQVDRNTNLSTVLNLLDIAHVNYRLEGRKLIITGTKEGGKP